VPRFSKDKAELISWILVALWRALQAGDTARATEIHRPIAKLVSYQTTLDAYVAVEKYLLVKQEIFKNVKQRGPVGFILDDATTKSIDSAFLELETILKR
jgi:4-hydroxy-tetrahydrodipicolinate synthase